MKLEEGMYVRTKWGIAKIIDFEAQNLLIKLDKKIMYENLPEYHDYTTIGNILKSSHNIIDLIQLGDYVNGEKITRVIPQDICGDEVLDYQHIFVNDKEIFKHKINSIVTKEAFESMKYEVK